MAQPVPVLLGRLHQVAVEQLPQPGGHVHAGADARCQLRLAQRAGRRRRARRQPRSRRHSPTGPGRAASAPPRAAHRRTPPSGGATSRAAATSCSVKNGLPSPRRITSATNPAVGAPSTRDATRSATSSCGSGARVTSLDAGQAGRGVEPVQHRVVRGELVASAGGQQRGPRRRAPDEERQQVQRSRIGPVQVLDHQRGSAGRAEGCEQVADGREQAGPVSRGIRSGMRLGGHGRDQGSDLRRHERCAPVQCLVQHRAARRAGQPVEGVGDRAVGQRFRHRQARPHQHRHVRDGTGDLSKQPRLADAGVAGDQSRRGRSRVAPQDAREPLPFAVAADEHRPCHLPRSAQPRENRQGVHHGRPRGGGRGSAGQEAARVADPAEAVRGRPAARPDLDPHVPALVGVDRQVGGRCHRIARHPRDDSNGWLAGEGSLGAEGSLDDGDSAAQRRSMWGKALCRLGRHHWERRRNEDGKGYVACSRCHVDHYMDGTEPTAWRVGTVGPG